MRKWILALTILVIVNVLLLFLLRRQPDPPSLPRELSVLGLSSLLYAQDHGGSMPADIKTLPDANMLNREVARDLSARVEYRVLKERASSIPSNVVVAYEAKANGSGQRSVLLMNGNVVGVPESQFAGFRPMPDDKVFLSGSTFSLQKGKD